MKLERAKSHIRLGCILLCLLCSGVLPLSAEQIHKHGVYKTFYSNGKAREVSWYKKGSLVRRKVFYEDGTLLREEFWNKDRMELKRGYTPQGRRSYVRNYKTKKMTLYNEDGSVKRVVPLKLQAPWKRPE